MSDEIIGYYNKRKEALLKKRERTNMLMEDLLVARYGKNFASALQKEVRLEYEKFIPEIPYIKEIFA